MRVMLLTPGTGHFYCGSCLRDDALGQALQAIGHDVTAVQLYLPMQLEREQQEQPVHMGGINVYLQQKTRLARYLPLFLSKWLDRPSLLRWASRRGNMTDAKGLGPMTVSILRGECGRQALEVDKLMRWIATQPKPDVVIVSNAMLVGIVRRLRESLGVPIVVTLQGETPFLDALSQVDADAAWQALRERAAEADALIAVSETYGTEMRDRLGATTDKLHVVHNGIDAASFAPTGTASPHPKTIGYLARMCQEKGLDTLIDAFLILKQRGTVKGLRLRVAGVQLAEDQRYVRELQQRIATSGFASDAEFLPNIDRAAKVAFLHTLSTLSVPARYQESFGLYLLEAMAAGVPVVQPRHAAFPEIIEATQGGVLCEPNNPEALANALESVLLNENLATTLGTQGRQSVATKFSANQMAQKVADICHRLIANEASSTAHS
ncbi:MAG: glycosyltransferase involved in cell wall biosynthesis [Planctomycetota bacterium]|jgi:glycosyltransferase involved in cell wall biosynthesis